jgi:hypothetical protein
MARDIELNVTASDKVDPGLASVERKFKRTSDKIKKDSDKFGDGLAKGVAEFGEKLGSIVGVVSPELGKSLTKAFASAGEAGGPLLIAGVAGAVVVAAPLIGATISAAVIGGAGIGGVVGGLLVASKDARVQSAADEMGKRLEVRLQTAGESFIQPTIQGIHTIEAALDSINVDQIFKDSAEFVQPLAEGVASAMADLGDGIESLIHNAGPVINSISKGIAEIGDSIGDGLASLADNGDDAASALNVVFFAITSSLDSVFATVNALTELYGALNKIGGLGVLGTLADNTNDVSKAAQTAGTSLATAAQNIGNVGDSAVGAGHEVQSLAEHLDEVTGAARSLFDSTTSVGEAIDRVTAAAKANGKTLDSNSEKGRANREVLSGLAQSLQKQYDATVAVSGAGKEADGVASRNRATFIRLATSLTGSASQARHLADEILGIPSSKTATVNANTHDAAARLSALQDKLAAVRSKTITVTVAVNAGALNKARLGKLGPQAGANYDATQSFSFADGGTSRIGGPVPVDVNSTVQNTIFLDGKFFAATIDTAVRNDRKRAEFRAKVGKR